MDDLQDLNRRIFRHAGASNENLLQVVQFVSVCLGKLKPSAKNLLQALADEASDHDNNLDVIVMNKEYLRFARQVSRDIATGDFSALIVLHVNLEQAKVLASISNEQISRLARRWPGTLYEVSRALNRQMPPMHASAAHHYAATMLAA